MWANMILSKNFVITGVSATGRWSLRVVTANFFGVGMMVVAFMLMGTAACWRERLKMLVKTPTS